MPQTPRPPRHFGNIQISFIIALWLFLTILILIYAELTLYTLFVIAASGIIVFVPIYKARRREKRTPRK